MLPHKAGIVQSNDDPHDFLVSNQSSAELSDSENAEINRSFSNLQVSPRESRIPHNKMDEESCHSELNFHKFLTKMGLVDVILIQQPRNDKEYLSNVEVKMTKDNEVLISDLIETLKGIGFSLHGSMIFYYDFMADLFVYCGNDPLKTNIFVTPQGKTKQIMLKFRKPQNIRIKQEEIEESSKIHLEDEEEKKENISINQGKKRIKERVIGDVIQKVVLWRQMHDGIEENGKKVQIPLDVAAQRVGISKKTLDDYLFQIKLGKKYNFNFKNHENDKIGILRSFVKKHRQLERETERFKEENIQQHIRNTLDTVCNNQRNNLCCTDHINCPNCHRTSSPTCKKEANIDFDIINYICTDSIPPKNSEHFYFKQQETF